MSLLFLLRRSASKVALREKGIRHDLIDAVFALGDEDDLVRLVARVEALQAFLKTDDGANLLAGYKRAANILKAERKRTARPSSARSIEKHINRAGGKSSVCGAGQGTKPRSRPRWKRRISPTPCGRWRALRGPVDAFFETCQSQCRRCQDPGEPAASSGRLAGGAFIRSRIFPRSKVVRCMTKWVYAFGDGKAEGEAGMKNLLGGKGANLAEMSNLGLPVPPGFSITTEVCTYYYANRRNLSRRI